MTIAQQLEQKGIEKGIEKGMERGIEKGIEKGKLEVARTMLQKGVDDSTVLAMTGLSKEALAEVHYP